MEKVRQHKQTPYPRFTTTFDDKNVVVNMTHLNHLKTTKLKLQLSICSFQLIANLKRFINKEKIGKK